MLQKVLIALFSVLVGWFAARSFTEEAPDPLGVMPMEETPIAQESPGELPAKETAEAAQTGERVAREVVEPGPDELRADELFSMTLLAMFDQEFRRGWMSQRSAEPQPGDSSEGEKDFRAGVLALPFSLGARGAEEANGQEQLELAIEGGDWITLLGAIDDGRYEPSVAEASGAMIDQVMVRQASRSSIDGTNFANDDSMALLAGTEIVFGPGVHSLNERRLRGPDGSTLPADITVSGAGMDVTLLRINDISVRGVVERLAFRDLTIDAEGDGLFDLRYAQALLALERVRIVNFDAGHGGCYLFDVREGTMLLASQCEFVGGYGKSPGRGHLFRSDPVVARFEDCSFSYFDVNPPSGERISFSNCRFELLNRNPIPNAPAGVVYKNCTFTRPLGEVEDRSTLKKKLSDLFWQVDPK